MLLLLALFELCDSGSRAKGCCSAARRGPPRPQFAAAAHSLMNLATMFAPMQESGAGEPALRDLDTNMQGLPPAPAAKRQRLSSPLSDLVALVSGGGRGELRADHCAGGRRPRCASLHCARFQAPAAAPPLTRPPRCLPPPPPARALRLRRPGACGHPGGAGRGAARRGPAPAAAPHGV